MNENEIAACLSMTEAARRGDETALSMLVDRLAEAADAGTIRRVIEAALYLDVRRTLEDDPFPGVHQLHVRARKTIRRLIARLQLTGTDNPVIADLARFSHSDLMAMRNCGPTTIKELRGFLAAHGISLRAE